MEVMKYIEIEQLIQCGKLTCLQQCCANGQLPLIASVLRGLTTRDLGILQNMLCGCSTSTSNPNPNPTGNACFDTVVGWVKDHSAMINGIQTTLIVLNGTSIPIVDQAIAIVTLALEQLEDAGQAKPGDPTYLNSVVQDVCKALNSIESWRKSAVNAMPDIVKPLLDGITALMTDAASLATCCAVPTSAPTPQLPTPDTGGLPPQLPSGGPDQNVSCTGPTSIEDQPIKV